MRLQEFTDNRPYGKRMLESRLLADKIIKECEYGLRTHFFKGQYATLPTDGFLMTPQARQSKESGNYYTVLMDNLLDWQMYPERSHSLIFANNTRVANQFGSVIYRIIPLNDAVLGICPESDIWGSFSKVAHNIGDFNAVLQYFKISDTSYNDFIMSLAELEPSEYSRFLSTAEEQGATSEFIQAMQRANQEPEKLAQVFEKFYDPDANGFAVKSIKEFHHGSFYGDREVWTNSPCYLVKSGGTIDLMLQDSDLGREYLK